MHDIIRWLAIEIFIADGGVDDWQDLNDDERRAIVTEQLHNFAHDPVWVDLIVKASRDMEEAH